jgi:alkanesulfonate monooxygenase SsuD/methylene tetrahydromethanopterin reductase-like flavin-dependent oxidoreductase (luciferase family)
MKISAVLSPVADWPRTVAAARAADAAGLDAIGLYDHYHSARPEWAYICGWSAYGALAALTERVRLVPMVLNNLHYELGVLAKESAVLSLASEGRFELAIGAGDWPESFVAWGAEFPPADARLDRLEETVDALRRLWTGQPVTADGTHVRLNGAISTPAPPVAPRVVVGVGGSRKTLARAVEFADEINVYHDPVLIREARTLIEEGRRPIGLSVFLSWEWDKWPADLGAAIEALEGLRVDRAFVSVGADDMVARVTELARIGGS